MEKVTLWAFGIGFKEFAPDHAENLLAMENNGGWMPAAEAPVLRPSAEKPNEDAGNSDGNQGGGKGRKKAE